MPETVVPKPDLERVVQQINALDNKKFDALLKLRIDQPLLDDLDNAADRFEMDRSKLVRLVLTNFVEGAKELET